MICYKCGKTIDDEVPNCPECDSNTKNGLLTLTEGAKRWQTVHENQIFTTIKPKDNTKTERLVAMILGLIGNLILLASLLMECYSYAAPRAGTASISMATYLDVRIMDIFNLIEMSLVFILCRFAVPQIMVGSSVALWTGYIFWKIRQIASTSRYLSVNYGLGLYMLILSAAMLVASGITAVVAANKTKALGIDDRKPKMLKNMELLTTVLFGFAIVFCSVFEMSINLHG